jgi:hypothetical protein
VDDLFHGFDEEIILEVFDDFLGESLEDFFFLELLLDVEVLCDLL